MNKICYFINSDWYFNLHWLDRALSAKENGFEVFIITRFHGDEYFYKFSELGFRCYRLPLKERSYNFFGFFYSAIRAFYFLRQIGPSVLHCITIKPIIIGGLYSKIKSKPMVANLVGLGRVFNAAGFCRKWLKKIVCSVYSYIFSNNKSRIVFEHDADFQTFRECVKFPEENAVIIDGCGVDIKMYSFSYENENDIPIVFFASRMLHNKGLSTLINIKNKLSIENINFRLLVAGILVDDDPDAIKSAEIQQWVNSGDIEWLGTRNDIDTLIAQSNIVALPTLYPEGVPRILIEGAAKGRACIAYDSGGCKSIVIDNVTGYLITER
ncbi:glycosyltransferase family 4 protein [Tatumella sp. JGM130]|uniref:glycosyltransferase family 4 protein n=1 Tax=Tatumella sp. JGM130 TaxID=2799797 RepID=UPI001BAF98F0|nr:glycosyltransferase family 4 protein [Tatumella sp. JGM130]MBS0894834.1 glycosyltransferase family 4 protein [Tatumella sp. JGM130]